MKNPLQAFGLSTIALFVLVLGALHVQSRNESPLREHKTTTIDLPGGLTSGLETRSKFWLEISEATMTQKVQWIPLVGEGVPENHFRMWPLQMAGEYVIQVVSHGHKIIDFLLKNREGQEMSDSTPPKSLHITNKVILEIVAHGAISNQGYDTPQRFWLRIRPEGEILRVEYTK